MEEAQAPGLGTETAWPKTPAKPEEPAIDILKPGSDIHAKVLEYLTKRLEFSERKMSDFYDRWEVNEKKIQAYVDLTKWEAVLQKMNDEGKPPQVVSIIIPYSYAIINTITTFLLHTFAGRRPMLQVATRKPETTEAARMMELVIDYQCEHTRLVRKLYQFCQDTQVYSLGVLRTMWETEKGWRTQRSASESKGFFGNILGKSYNTRRELRTVYEGNSVECVDPFLFFPDPNVPMKEVARRGEFVFWRSFVGKHKLLTMQSDGVLKYVGDVSAKMPAPAEGRGENSSRNLRSRGEAFPGSRQTGQDGEPYYQVDQGTCWIVPKELGLGSATRPELWLFTMLNKQQIVQAEPLNYDHGMHPVCISEPQGFGYGFGQLGTADYLGPIQDFISWLVSSRIANVRTAVNNMFVVDPFMIEMSDLRNPEPGKLIRMKRTAMMQDAKSAVHQLSVTDVTSGHLNDLEVMFKLGQYLTGVTDNLMGMQDQGGRKTATEVRTSSESAASRISAIARIISSEALVDLAEQMSVNTQQFISQEFYINVVGQDGNRTPLMVDPTALNGDFQFPVHDGTLPLDRVALLEVWKEILIGAGGDQELRQRYDMPKMFEFVAELGGARNIESMRRAPAPQPGVQMMPDAALGEMAAGNPNLIPIPQRA